jgi:hypothetical protein
LITFKERKVYKDPTETLVLKSLKGIKSYDDRDFTFMIEAENLTYFVSASSNA